VIAVRRKNVSELAFEAQLDAIAAKREAIDAKIESRKAMMDVIEVRRVLQEILKVSRARPVPRTRGARILDAKMTGGKENLRQYSKPEMIKLDAEKTSEKERTTSSSTRKRKKKAENKTLQKSQERQTKNQPREENGIIARILFGKNIYR